MCGLNRKEGLDATFGVFCNEIYILNDFQRCQHNECYYFSLIHIAKETQIVFQARHLRSVIHMILQYYVFVSFYATIIDDYKD